MLDFILNAFTGFIATMLILAVVILTVCFVMWSLTPVTTTVVWRGAVAISAVLGVMFALDERISV